MTDSVTNGSVEERALKIIEDKYPNKRLKRMHAFFISVEKNGGSADLGTEVQLNDREDWVSDVVARQKEKNRLKRVFIVFSVFVILFCLAFLYNFLWLRQIFVGIAPMQRSESTLLQQKLLKVPVSSSFLFGFVKLLIQKYNNKTKEEKICNQ